MSKSLEALKNLKTTAIETIRALSYPASNIVKEDIEYIEEQATTIEKDLEVLEIFRNKINIALEPNYLSCYGGDYITEEEYEKIKEWIDNEN